ncbi:MAG TPA: hypothetical protein VNT92_05720 [Acidimicrobiia bacterium]|nr:hypothetical protein [Acidimicrobiia bacterium]
MIRNLKALGLAVVAVFAMSALTASAAMAGTTSFHSNADHTTITGEQEGTNTFSVNAGTIHCSTATFSGTSSATTTQEITIAPSYSGCKITAITLETVEATVDMNGCHYLLTSSGQVHVTCPSAPIRVTSPICTVTVHPQTVNSVDYTNTGSGTTTATTVESTASSIKYTQSAICPGGGGEASNGVYAGSVTTTCENAAGNHVGCWWSTTP